MTLEVFILTSETITNFINTHPGKLSLSDIKTSGNCGKIKRHKYER